MTKKKERKLAGLIAVLIFIFLIYFSRQFTLLSFSQLLAKQVEVDWLKGILSKINIIYGPLVVNVENMGYVGVLAFFLYQLIYFLAYFFMGICLNKSFSKQKKFKLVDLLWSLLVLCLAVLVIQLMNARQVSPLFLESNLILFSLAGFIGIIIGHFI